MSNTKFTQGEWKVFGDWGVSYGANKFIAEACGDVGPDERFYNLRLIASAPDLYKALEEILSFTEPGVNVDRCTVVAIASLCREALESARGES